MKSSFFIKTWSSMLFPLLFLFVLSNSSLNGAEKNLVQRIYVNVSETEKILAPKGIDDYMTSFAGVAKITQTSDKMLLIEAIRAGRTTITVICGDDIYRYHITAFDGRGAEEAHINNEFADKGYTQLNARFDKVNRDQLLIEGKAETKEQLDDAVQIAKKYVSFVVLRAKTISDTNEDEEASSPEERDIEKTIEKIANVKGLRVKVKFEMRQRSTKITESESKGNPIITSSNTTASGATTTTTAPLVPPDSGGREPEPIKGSLEESKVEQLEGVPAKIFLFGRVKDDLQRAQAIRVARTFCQLVVSFLTVEDPIQIRFQAWIMDVNLTKARNLGVTWPNSVSYRAFQGATDAALIDNPANPLGVGATTAGTIFNKMFSVGGTKATPMQNITAGLNENVDLAINLLETESVGKVMQAPVINVVNGQLGYFTTGGSFPVTTSTSNLGVTTTSTTYQSFQTYIQVLPLNLERSGPAGESIDILNSDDKKTVPTMMDAKALLNPVGKNNFLRPPEIDDSLKMVDEYGNIGVRVYVGIESISPTNVIVGSAVPTLENKTTETRAIVRDGQPIVLSGFYSKTNNTAKRKVPFFGDIPLIGGMFKNNNTLNDDTREVIVVLKPTIVRLGSSSPETIFPEPKNKEIVQMVHDFDPKFTNKIKGKNEPFKGDGTSKKKSAGSKDNHSNEANSVEQVPLIDVTPKASPSEEAPVIRKAEPIVSPQSSPVVPVTTPESPTAPSEPIVSPESSPVVPVATPEPPTPPSEESKPPEDSPQQPTRMKEGPKTRVRPEAPDDSGLLKEQTKLRLRSAQQEVRNRP